MQHPKKVLFVIYGAAVAGGLWLNLTEFSPPAFQTNLATRYSNGLAAHPDDAVPSGLLTSTTLVPYRIQEGQTLGEVFESLGLNDADRRQLVGLASSRVDLRKLRPGNTYRPHFANGQLARFDLGVDGRGELAMIRSHDGWSESYREFERLTELVAIQGHLDSSLEQDVRDAGAEGMLAYKMADVFQWDLDFSRDLRVGDEFEVVFERVYLDGEYRGLGDVVAAVYRGGNRELRGYRYGDESGYYDQEGRPLQKMFLRSPMQYSRITSRFSRRRFHPVLKRNRPHYGVDYGAPRGTAVRVTANGTVVSAGRNGGAGRMVKVRHTSGYQTAYLHLSGYGKGVRRGARVAQGQTIGYVGSSGLATGPHLDYRVEYNGRWINPLSLNNVPADPIPLAEHDQFLVWRKVIDRALSSGQVDSQLAALMTPTSSSEPAS